MAFQFMLILIIIKKKTLLHYNIVIKCVKYYCIEIEDKNMHTYI